MDFRSPLTVQESDEAIRDEPYRPFYKVICGKPVLVKQGNDYDRAVFRERPYLGALLFDNVSSDARDHAANERTFLAWLKLSVYMAIVSVAIVLSFHLKSEPSTMEKKAALPLGIVFWILSLLCLVSGLANYIDTVTRYSKRQALVQAGWKTQLVFTIVSAAIVAACVLFLTTNSNRA